MPSSLPRNSYSGVQSVSFSLVFVAMSSVERPGIPLSLPHGHTIFLEQNVRSVRTLTRAKTRIHRVLRYVRGLVGGAL